VFNSARWPTFAAKFASLYNVQMITTERFILRPFEREDYDAYLSMVVDAQPDVPWRQVMSPEDELIGSMHSPDSSSETPELSDAFQDVSIDLQSAIGTIASALYRLRLAELDDVPRTGVETLSTALATAETLPHASALRLIAHARAAFMDGMRLAMLIAVLVTVGSAVLVYLSLGRPGRTADKNSSLEAL